MAQNVNSPANLQSPLSLMSKPPEELMYSQQLGVRRYEVGVRARTMRYVTAESEMKNDHFCAELEVLFG